jgi:hypothetical protein
MAERRMFSKTIIDSDAFLDMPLSTQALYFHLSMRADDEGFVGNPRKILRMIGASEDDIRILIMKRFILAFDSGIVVIKHWKIHNYIQNDRYKETTYLEEKATLTLDGKRAYTECIQDVSKLEAQVSIGKESIVEDSIGKKKQHENSVLTTEFEEVWKFYPNKQGKEKSRNCYIKARKDGTTREEIESGVKRYAEYCKVKGIEKKYIKHGDTWFGNKSWQDDYDFISTKSEEQPTETRKGWC